MSIDEFNINELDNADYLFLGCWTKGHFLFYQHPDRNWVKFANQLPTIHDKKMVLFTTYKVATGSMFRRMKDQLKCDSKLIKLELKSRNGNLDAESKGLLRNTIKQK